MILCFGGLDVGAKISQVQLCNSIRGCKTTFLAKNMVFKEEITRKALIEQQNCTPSILESFVRVFK